MTPIDAVFGDMIRLRGYHLFPDEPTSDSTLQVTLEWETSAPVEKSHKVFAQLLDDRQQIIGQNDSEPAGGRYPTNTWEPGQAVIDRRGIPIAEGTPAGDYTLLIGLYDPITGSRLPLEINGNPAGDALPLATVTIAP